MKIFIYIIFFIAGFYAYVRFLEMTSVFYPSQMLTSHPGQAGLDYEDIYFASRKDIMLHGWLVKNKEAQSTVIFCHGNAGNVSDRMDKIMMFHAMGFNVLIFDYRGYGNSQGRSSEAGLYKDALAAYDYLQARNDIRKKHIVLYGESLGGVAAVDLAMKRDVSAVIVDSSFTNAKDMARRIAPFVPGFLVSLKLDNLSKVKYLNTPKLFIHSREDRTVPFEFGERLYREAKEPKAFLEIQGGHNDGYSHDVHYFTNGILSFLKENKIL